MQLDTLLYAATGAGRAPVRGSPPEQGDKEAGCQELFPGNKRLMTPTTLTPRGRTAVPGSTTRKVVAIGIDQRGSLPAASIQAFASGGRYFVSPRSVSEEWVA